MGGYARLGPCVGPQPGIRHCMPAVKQRRETVAATVVTITVTAFRWLRREFLPYAVLRVIDLWWLYALLGVIDLWWLYGWYVGVTALVVFCGIAWLALHIKKVASPSKRGQARDHL